MDPQKIRELRARCRQALEGQGSYPPIEELRAALDAIRGDRMALIGAKPPKAKTAKAAKEDKSAALFLKLFGTAPAAGGPDAPHS